MFNRREMILASLALVMPAKLPWGDEPKSRIQSLNEEFGCDMTESELQEKLNRMAEYADVFVEKFVRTRDTQVAATFAGYKVKGYINSKG